NESVQAVQLHSAGGVRHHYTGVRNVTCIGPKTAVIEHIRNSLSLLFDIHFFSFRNRSSENRSLPPLACYIVFFRSFLLRAVIDHEWHKVGTCRWRKEVAEGRVRIQKDRLGSGT